MSLCQEAWLLYPNSGYDEKFSISVFVNFNLFFFLYCLDSFKGVKTLQGEQPCSAIFTQNRLPLTGFVYVWPSRVAISQATKLALTFDPIIKTTNCFHLLQV